MRRLATKREMAEYHLTRNAVADLRAIADYGLENFGFAKARQYRRGLEKCFRSLARTPAIGLSADELVTGIRRYKYQSHWIFYLASGKGITIVRVLHTRMDFVKHL